MDLWKILVMGTIQLNCNWDYDKLQEMVNNHKTLRQMLGLGMMDDEGLMGRCDSFVVETDDKAAVAMVKSEPQCSRQPHF